MRRSVMVATLLFVASWIFSSSVWAQDNTDPASTPEDFADPASALLSMASRSRPSLHLQAPPPTRWGGKMGILGVVGPVYSPPNATYHDGSWPFVSGGVSYRLQSPGKRTLLQPEIYMDLGANPALSPPDTRINAGFPEGHAYIGTGIAERTSLYLPGSTAVYFGGGVGIYETTSFHLENGAVQGSNDAEPYTSVADYSCARLGLKLFAGLQFHRGFFTELSYQNLGSADSYRYRSAGLYLGYRR